MLIGLAFTLIPTVSCYRVLSVLPPFRSQLFKIVFAWFLGQYLSTLAIFLLAIGFVSFTDQVLLKASVLWLLFLLASVPLLYRATDWRAVLRLLREVAPSPWKLVALAVCLGFSVLLFSRHLLQTESQIYTSQAFWDFNIHFPIIQTFVHGDNFPPENESFSGFPMTYHYFFDLLTAIYAALGMDLVAAMNYVSGSAFFVMLVAIIGMAEELFFSWKVGAVAVLLTATSSSLRFIPFLSSQSSKDPWDVFVEMVSNRAHPFFFSFVQGNPFAYNGTMFNLFFFVAERQMIVGIIYFICCGWLLYRRQELTSPVLLVTGMLVGLFLQWHLFVTISVVSTAFFLLVFSSPRKPVVLVLLGALPVLGIQYLYFSALTSSPLFFPDVKSFPRLSFDFPSMPEYPFSPINAAGYYFFAYGVKVILVPLGIFFLARRNRSAAVLLAALILPTFILLNTIQVSPLSVWDNHKWLRPMNVFVDLVVAYAVFSGLFLQRPLDRRLAISVLLPLLIASGIIELMPFLNSKPASLYAQYPSSAIHAIRDNSEPRAAFLSTEAKELHLAGRKIFAPNAPDEPGAIPFAEAAKMNRSSRDRTAQAVYAAPNRTAFCTLITEHKIDFVEFNRTNAGFPIFSQISDFPRFTARNEAAELMEFVNARAGCQQASQR